MPKSVRAGERRQRVTIQTATNAEAGTSAQTRTYTSVRTVNAKFTNIKKQVVDDRGNTLDVTVVINIRWQPDITIKNFLIYKGNRYAIASTKDITEFDQSIDCNCYLQEKVGEYQNPSPTSVPDLDE